MASLSDQHIFRFKKFSLVQGRTVMRVNTDGVLLGAWVRLPLNCNHILDIGTGCGVIALMLAQRISEANCENSKYNVSITGIEPHNGSFCDACDNFMFSFPDLYEEKGISLKAQNINLRQYVDLSGTLDIPKENLMISNPPYFSHSLKSSAEDKSMARHADSLPQSELIWAAEKILSPNGVLALILPDNEAESFIRKMRLAGIFALRRLCKVRTTDAKPFTRYMMEFVFKQNCPSILIEEQLTLMENGTFTISYMELTQSFYLNF